MSQKTFYIQTLGCAKNAVDSLKAAQGLLEDGLVETDDPSNADVVVVNTCAFIEQAREESIATTLELQDQKKNSAKLVVTGCMAQRYEDELKIALPQVDAVVGFANEANIAQSIFEPIELKARPTGIRDLLDMPRPKSTSPWAYLKLAEGCNRNCAFCAIPTFRGKQRSRTIESIMTEARELVSNGVKELVLVAQDVAWYGKDLDGDSSCNLSNIMRELDKLRDDGLVWLRVLYIYPSELRGELLETMLTLPSSVAYFDLSLQHAHPELLRMMKRPGSTDKFMSLINEIRAAKPESVFRSNFIVGFPGETEEHHQELLSFISKAGLTWTGFFPYSHEKDTLSYSYSNQIDHELALERLRELQRVQDDRTQQNLINTIGRKYSVITDEIEDGFLIARGFDSAPEIDGVIRIDNQSYKPGDFIDIEVADVAGMDRFGEVIPV